MPCVAWHSSTRGWTRTLKTAAALLWRFSKLVKHYTDKYLRRLTNVITIREGIYG